MSHLLRRPSKPSKSIGNIELGAVLGEGGFGKVLLGYDTVRKQNVAVKFIDKKLVKEKNLSGYVDREIEMMKKLRHPYVVSLLSVTISTKGHYLVMELAENGELFDRIVESKRFDEATARRYFQQLMSALIYCHGKGIVHRDLKAENLLLGKNSDLLICDFGLSRYVGLNSTMNSQTDEDNKVIFRSLAGSADYQAPEVIGEGGYHGFSCDVWSSGVILFFMICGYLPFAGKSVNDTHNRITKIEYNCKNNKYLSDSLKDLLANIFVVNPKLRFTTADIVAHPWFQAGANDGYITPASPTSNAMSPTRTPDCFLSPRCGGKVTNGEVHTYSSPNNNSPEYESSYPNLELEKLHAAFLSIDIDKSGYLSKSEVHAMLVKIHDKPVSDQEVDTFIAKFDHGAEGISEEQFIVGWTRNSDLSSAFDVYRLINLFHDDLEQNLLATLKKSYDEFIVFWDQNGVIPDEKLGVIVKSLDMTIDEGKKLLNMVQSMKEKITFDTFVSLCTAGDLLTKNSTVRRLRSVSMMFDLCEKSAVRTYINTGFTVTGMRETIAAKLQRCGSTIATVITRDNTGQGLIYGKHSQEGIIVLEVGIQMLPSARGYTKLMAYRIRGKTDIFHNWFRELIKLLHDEILSFENDTAPAGESELM